MVETAYGISSTLSEDDVDTQEELLSKVIKVSDFQNSTKMEALVERYTAAYDNSDTSSAADVLLADTSDSGTSILDASNGISSTIPADSILNLFTSSSSGGGVSSSTLLSLAKLHKGG